MQTGPTAHSSVRSVCDDCQLQMALQTARSDLVVFVPRVEKVYSQHESASAGSRNGSVCIPVSSFTKAGSLAQLMTSTCCVLPSAFHACLVQI